MSYWSKEELKREWARHRCIQIEDTHYTDFVALPFELQQAIEQELASLDHVRITRAASRMSTDYRALRFGESLVSAEARAAYLVTRLPATYAACSAVFREMARLHRNFSPVSMLDLGAGPGTAAWAAMERWPSLERFTFLESNRDFAEMGRRMASHSVKLEQAQWQIANMALLPELPSADLVVLSYAMGETSDTHAAVSAAWLAANQSLVIIEPGTPRNFEQIARVRRELIAQGAHVLAPCPHKNVCPMHVTNDWCHFAVRVERTAEHRRMKGGALGYEDEKFSYLAFAKSPVEPAESRIVRHPRTHGGFIELTLCTSEGLQNRTITRSRRDLFRAARRAVWGDEWRQLE